MSTSAANRLEHQAVSGRRGGVRPGAGRPPTFDRPASVRSFTLDDRTLEAIAAWQADPTHKAASASEALRQMVEIAHRWSRGLEHACPLCGGPMASWKPGATCQTCRNRKGGHARHRPT
jgi:hypothetical protein